MLFSSVRGNTHTHTHTHIHTHIHTHTHTHTHMHTYAHTSTPFPHLFPCLERDPCLELTYASRCDDTIHLKLKLTFRALSRSHGLQSTVKRGSIVGSVACSILVFSMFYSRSLILSMYSSRRHATTAHLPCVLPVHA
jgi:hypothetical protein